jgi:ribosomal protein L11 methyltransferase
MQQGLSFDRWLVLSAPLPPPGEEPLMVEALRALGARAVERDGDRVLAWLPPPSQVDALLREAEAAIRAGTSLRDPVLESSWQSAEEWARRWSADQRARRVSGRIVVAPVGGVAAETGAGAGPSELGADRRSKSRGGEPALARDDDPPIIIRLDPAAAFGTADHATTRACLRLLDAWIRAGDRVLDLGTGSGILAIAAARLGARRVLALDSDPLACAAAAHNAALNGVERHVEVREEAVRPHRLARLGRWDGVVANIGTTGLVPALPALRKRLARGGWLILSGMLVTDRETFLAEAGRAGLALREEEVEGGWWTAVFL